MPPSARPPVAFALYDMDGLLLDTEGFYTVVTRRIVEPYGKSFDWGVKSKMIGKKAIDAARVLVRELDLPFPPERYLELRKEMLDELFPQAEAMPGARRLTDHLRERGVPQAVATSSRLDAYALKTSRHREWFARFDAVVTGDDPRVREGKPAPDIFLAAAADLGADPAECLVFEDAPAGMLAAKAAGMRVVVVPDPNMDPREFGGADQILASLEAFDPAEWGLPAFGDRTGGGG